MANFKRNKKFYFLYVSLTGIVLLLFNNFLLFLSKDNDSLKIVVIDVCLVIIGLIIMIILYRNIKLISHLHEIIEEQTNKLSISNKIHKEESEKIVSSELKYRRLVENSIQGIVIFGNGKIVYANPVFEKLLGYNFNDISSFKFRNVRNFFPNDSAKIIIENLRHRLSGDTSNQGYEIQVYHKNRQLLWFDVYSSITRYDGTDAIQLAFIDITDRKKSELALKENEEKYRLLFESEIDSIALIDTDTMRIVDCNTSFLKLYGYSREEVYDITAIDLTAEVDKTKNSIRKTISEQYDNVSLRYHKKKNGSVFPIELTSTLFNWREKKVICVITRDVSERVSSENKLKEYNDALIESNKAKDKFFSIVAHDLKSPFHGLLGLSHLLSEDFDKFTNDEIKQNVLLIRNSVNNVYGLVENLLQWSRIQLGYIEFTPVVFDFHKTLLDAMNLLESGMHKKHLSVINLVKKETLVYGDEKMILSVIQNLLSNAIKFSFSGGTIRLESEQLNAYTSISITDGGVGIPSEVIPKLFDIDSQYSTRGTNNESGTGLGLILCRELIEKNSGQINVKSELGKGSTFIFTIPSHKTANVN